MNGWAIDSTLALLRRLSVGLVLGLATTFLAHIAIAQRPADIPTVDNPLLARSDEEAKILGVLENMDKNQRRGMMNVPLDDGRLLRLLTEAVGATRVVEIGTSNGYSGIWICLALRKTDGHLITHEIDARRASLARENFKRAGIDDLTVRR